MLGCAEQFMLLCLFFRTVRCASPGHSATDSHYIPHFTAAKPTHTGSESLPPFRSFVVVVGLLAGVVGDVLRWLRCGWGEKRRERGEYFWTLVIACSTIPCVLYRRYILSIATAAAALLFAHPCRRLPHVGHCSTPVGGSGCGDLHTPPHHTTQIPIL